MIRDIGRNVVVVVVVVAAVVVGVVVVVYLTHGQRFDFRDI